MRLYDYRFFRVAGRVHLNDPSMKTVGWGICGFIPVKSAGKVYEIKQYDVFLYKLCKRCKKSQYLYKSKPY